MSALTKLDDPEALALFNEALSEWRCGGYIVWKPICAEWVGEHLGISTKELGGLMYEHFRNGGEIDCIVERRPEYRERSSFHYDFRFLVNDRRIYLETVLASSKTGPTVTVVSIHDA